jgi:hypothetical protein
MTKSIVENGVFTCPIFHGTTSLFIESIIENGLGGKDPLTTLRARETFTELFELGENQLGNDPFWIESRKKLTPLARQEYLGGNFSFQHGESYLTPIRECALDYATTSRLGGCELLYYMHILIKQLMYKQVDGIEYVVSQELVDILTTDHKPVLITLNHLPKISVATETGVCLEEQIATFDKYYLAGTPVNIGFKLIEPINSKHFQIEHLE